MTGRQFWVVVAEREDGGCFIVRADEKLPRFWNLNRPLALAANCLDKLVRFSRNSPDYENKNSTTSNHICTRLLCARAKHAGDQSSTGRVLSQFYDGGRVRCASFSHQWRWQHRAGLVFALQRHHRQL